MSTWHENKWLRVSGAIAISVVQHSVKFSIGRLASEVNLLRETISALSPRVNFFSTDGEWTRRD